MITYEYLCEDCGHAFEAEQRMSDDALTECPQCSGKVKRIIGGGVAAYVKTNAPACSSSPSPCAGRCPGAKSCDFAK